MGEIYEDEIYINNWSEDGLPDLGHLGIDRNMILSDFEIAEGDPLEQEQEGFTGNAGMTIDYWYHYGAVILWPQSQHARILENAALFVQMSWIDFYLENWKSQELGSQNFVRKIITEFRQYTFEENRYHDDRDFGSVARGLVKMKDSDFLEKSKSLLTKILPFVSSEDWQKLLETYNPSYFSDAFRKNGLHKKIKNLGHLLKILVHLDGVKNEKIAEFVQKEINHLPAYFEATDLTEDKDTSYYLNKGQTSPEDIIPILNHLFQLSQHQNNNKDWVRETTQSVSKKMPRHFVNEMLCPALLNLKIATTDLADSLTQICIKDLKKRTFKKPQPPADWVRTVPESSHYYSEVWKKLTPFLKSPTQKEWKYTANQSKRDVVESAIRNVEIDLKCSTIKTGRPYTLVVTKTQTAYQKDLKRWEEDVALLDKFEQ